MATDDKEFIIKLKKCKSLEDYRNLAEEYKIEIDKYEMSPERREIENQRIYRKIYQKYRTGHII